MEISVIEATFSQSTFLRPSFHIEYLSLTPPLELQGQDHAAIIGGMRESLVDSWA